MNEINNYVFSKVFFPNDYIYIYIYMSYSNFLITFLVSFFQNSNNNKQ